MTKLAAAALLLLATGCANGPALAADGCPKDLLAARGASCAVDGKTCTAGPGQFTHLLMCSRGKWTEMDAPPPPPPPAK